MNKIIKKQAKKLEKSDRINICISFQNVRIKKIYNILGFMPILSIFYQLKFKQTLIQKMLTSNQFQKIFT